MGSILSQRPTWHQSNRRAGVEISDVEGDVMRTGKTRSTACGLAKLFETFQQSGDIMEARNAVICAVKGAIGTIAPELNTAL